MLSSSCRHARRAALSLTAAVSMFAPAAAIAASVTECTGVAVCYCINGDFKDAIAEKVDYYRKAIAAERAKGKAIGYMSVPLSSTGGGYFNVNREVAEKIKERVETRLGPNSAWLLNPTAREADLPTLNNVRAGQGDYLLMWTRILEGPKALGEDFDFIYFVGPTDFAGFFGLTGKDDMDRIAAYFDDRLAKDADLKRAVERGSVSKAAFRNYYALRASAAFSLGAHDEWNVIRAVNQRRRDDKALGVANQLPVMFDGRAVSSGEYEQQVAGGNVGACKAD
ncbi:MAG: hypothetical protein ABWY07_11600 [Burkholderiales bacterium]